VPSARLSIGAVIVSIAAIVGMALIPGAPAAIIRSSASPCGEAFKSWHEAQQHERRAKYHRDVAKANSDAARARTESARDLPVGPARDKEVDVAQDAAHQADRDLDGRQIAYHEATKNTAARKTAVQANCPSSAPDEAGVTDPNIPGRPDAPRPAPTTNGPPVTH
jgi:hypothetical protein